MITIKQLHKEWGDKLDAPDTKKIRRLINYLPSEISFDGRVLKSNKLKYNTEEDYNIDF